MDGGRKTRREGAMLLVVPDRLKDEDVRDGMTPVDADC